MTLNFRQQVVVEAPGMIGGVALHHQTIQLAQAVFRHQGVQVGGAVGAVAQENQLAAAAQVIPQQLHVLGGVIHGRARNQHRRRILGNALSRYQRQIHQLYVLHVQRALLLAGQLLLTVAGEGVDPGQILGGHIIHRAGQLLLAVEQHIIDAGGVVVAVIVGVQVIGVDHLAAVTAHHDDTALAGRLGAILLSKGGINRRILLFPAQVLALLGIAIQEGDHALAFIAALGQIVEGNVLLQARQQVLCGVANGVKPVLAHVPLGVFAGQLAHHQIHQNHRHQHKSGKHTGHCAVLEYGLAGGLPLQGTHHQRAPLPEAALFPCGLFLVLFEKLHCVFPPLSSSGAFPAPAR